MTAYSGSWASSGWFTADDCRLDDFPAVVETTTDLAECPYAGELRENVLAYRSQLRHHIDTPDGQREVRPELAQTLADGPHIVVFAGAFDDLAVGDRATAAFEAMIAEQKAADVVASDHFARRGVNERYSGWYVLEQDTVRTQDPVGEGPVADVRVSADHPCALQFDRLAVVS